MIEPRGCVIRALSLMYHQEYDYVKQLFPHYADPGIHDMELIYMFDLRYIARFASRGGDDFIDFSKQFFDKIYKRPALVMRHNPGGRRHMCFKDAEGNVHDTHGIVKIDEWEPEEALF